MHLGEVLHDLPQRHSPEVQIKGNGDSTGVRPHPWEALIVNELPATCLAPVELLLYALPVLDDLMYRQLISCGKEPPQYDDSGNQVRLVIINRIDDNLARMLYDMRRKSESISLEEMILLSVLKDTRTIDVKQASQALQYGEKETRLKLDKMATSPSGVLSLVTSRGKRYYRLSDRIWRMLGDELGYYKNGEIAEGQWKSRVMDVVDKKGMITSGQCQALLSISRGKAFRLLKTLEEEKLLKMVGSTRGAKYVKLKDDPTSDD